jgi:4'-phosphopantetheinyl transferase
MAMCALHSAPVGADIERVDAVDDVTAWRIMSRQELFAFDKAQDKNNFFYKIWTLKEAYIKYNGRGIGTDLHSLTVYPEGDRIVTNISGCQFELINTIPGYQAAVCASDVSHSLSWVSKQSLDQF